MSKLKFTFQVKSSTDGKTNFIAITSISTEDNKTFLIPEEYQAATLHKEICATNNFAIIKNTLKRRHQFRTVWIAVSDRLKKTYFDEDDNLMFMDMYLDEVNEESKAAQRLDENNTVVKILEKLVENQEKQKKQNVKKTAERFVLEKYDGRTANAHQWL